MASAGTPAYPNESQGPKILGAIVSTWAIAMLVLGLRIIARRMSRVGLWWDDWLVVAGFGMYTIFTGLFVSSVMFGAGKHISEVTPQQYSKMEVSFYIAEILFAPTISLVKLSVLAFYWRIFSASTRIKKPIWVTVFLVIAWCIAAVVALVLQCIPIAKLAHPELPGHCSDKFALFLGGSIPEVVTDFIILIIPIPFIWKLHTTRRQKWLLTGVFLLGIFACISSILRLWAFMVRDYKSTDKSWTTTDSIVWSCVEVALAMISACLLSLRPIITYLRTGSAIATTEAEKSFAHSRSKSSGATASSDGKGSWKRSVDPRTDTSVTQMSIGRNESIRAPMAMRDDLGRNDSIRAPLAMRDDLGRNDSIRAPLAMRDDLGWNDSIRVPMAMRDDIDGGITALPSLGPELGDNRFLINTGDDLPEVVQVHEMRA